MIIEEKYEDFLSSWKSNLASRYTAKQFNLHRFWLKEIDETHQVIRRLLGGTYKEYDVNTGNNQTGISDRLKILELFNSLCNNYDKAKDSKGSLISDISLNSRNYHGCPTPEQILKGIHDSKIKDGDHAAWDVSLGIKQSLKNGKLNQIAKFNCDKIFNQMKQEWKKCYVTKDEFKAIIDTRGMAFCMIGEYPKVDASSCFKFSSGHNSKIMISELANTFVITFSKKESGVFSRIIGFFNEETNSMNFFNFYFAHNAVEGNILESLKLISGDLLKCDPDKLKINMDLVSLPHGIYLNPYMNLTLSDKALSDLIYLKEKGTGFQYRKPCPCDFCHQPIQQMYQTDEDTSICATCIGKLKYGRDTIKNVYTKQCNLMNIILDEYNHTISSKYYPELLKAYGPSRIKLGT